MGYHNDDYADEEEFKNEDHSEEGQEDPSQYGDSIEDNQQDKLKDLNDSDNSDNQLNKTKDLSSEEDQQQELLLIDRLPDKLKENIDNADDYNIIQSTSNQIRITSPYLSKYEKAMIIGKRAEQISKNSPIYIEISHEELKHKTALHLAEMEFEQNRIPMLIRRFLPDRTFEDWKVSELKKFNF